jgi:plasmid stabilization system protein ParE
MQLHFFEEAAEELEQSRAWYRQRSESAEAAFLRDLDHAVETVSEAPHRWPRYLGGTRRYVFPNFPYSLIYFLENEALHIVAVAHGKRKPGYWRKRIHR